MECLAECRFHTFQKCLDSTEQPLSVSFAVAQGKREGTFTTDIGAKYEIPHLHLSFTATLSDVFNTFKKVYTIDTPQLQQRLEQKMNTRVFYIGIAWNFNTLKQK